MVLPRGHKDLALVRYRSMQFYKNVWYIHPSALVHTLHYWLLLGLSPFSAYYKYLPGCIYSAVDNTTKTISW